MPTPLPGLFLRGLCLVVLTVLICLMSRTLSDVPPLAGSASRSLLVSLLLLPCSWARRPPRSTSARLRPQWPPSTPLLPPSSPRTSPSSARYVQLAALSVPLCALCALLVAAPWQCAASFICCARMQLVLCDRASRLLTTYTIRSSAPLSPSSPCRRLTMCSRLALTWSTLT